MKLKQRWMGVVLIALLASTTLTGCGMFRNIFGGDDREHTAALAEFVSANQVFTTDQVAYTVARMTLRSARLARKIADDKWFEYRIQQNAIIAAAPLVEADLATWGATGKKPPTYDSHNKTLRDAVAAVALMAKEFE